MKPISLFALAAIAVPGALAAQDKPLTVIAVPPLTIRDSSDAETAAIGMRAAEIIAADLRSSGDIVPLGPDPKATYSYPEVNAPNFGKWRATGAKAVVTGFVTKRSDGRLTIGCYLYDSAAGDELGRQGFVVAAGEWRRAAHRCSDLVYSKLSGRPGWFDSRIAYVAESGPQTSLTKRIALMDADGSNHRYLTAGESTVLSPALSPKGDRIAFVSFSGGQPHVEIADTDKGEARPLLADGATSFAPTFSPDGNQIAFSLARGGNTDIYVVDAAGGTPRRLTTAPGTDTSPAFSPDGKQILFESDRSGAQQIYVMTTDGLGQRRLSFGPGGFASPSWSPDGARIGFTRIGPDGQRIGVMNADGSDPKILTAGPRDEAPSWGASSRHLLFQRGDAAGRTRLSLVSTEGGAVKPVPTPQAGSDPDWAGGQ